MRQKKVNGSRGSFGQIKVLHKGKSIFTSVGSESYEGTFGPQVASIPVNGVVPPGYAHRPDLISNLFLGSPSTWWIICETNAIFDVFEQLKSGSPIRVPLE